MKRSMGFVAVTVMSVGCAHAATEPKANCSMFHKESDGRWISTIQSRVGNPKSYVTLQPGLPIARDLVVVGINVSDTIDRLCGAKP